MKMKKRERAQVDARIIAGQGVCHNINVVASVNKFYVGSLNFYSRPSFERLELSEIMQHQRLSRSVAVLAFEGVGVYHHHSVDDMHVGINRDYGIISHKHGNKHYGECSCQRS